MNPYDLDTTNIDERTARVLLATIKPPFDGVTGRLVAAHGAVATLGHALGDEQVEGQEDWLIDYWRAGIIERTASRDVAGAFLAALDPDPRVLVPSDPEWPTGLSDLGEFEPLALWAEGDTGLLSRPRSERVAVVGSQAATDHGVLTTQRLCHDLVGHGLQIISGGAHGIDAEAHRGALVAGGATIVVLAGGLDHPFPPSNTSLFHYIRDEGGVLLAGTPPSMLASNAAAAARHKITAALSGAVVAIEATHRSATMDAIDEAIELGRPVAAVPGPLHDASSAGSHELIRDLRAHPVQSATDVVRLLDHDRETRDAAAPAPRGPLHRPSPPQGPSI